MPEEIRIAVAEDDAHIAAIQRQFLQRIDGIELVGITHDLDEAEALVAAQKPDLLLLDIHFPSGSGLDLLRTLRSRNSSTDIILITAAKEVDTLREALRGGVFDYILKPLTFERLSEAIAGYRRHRDKLLQMDSLDQRDVDTLLPRASSPESPDMPPAELLPKGIDGLTLNKVHAVLLDSDRSRSAEEVGNEIGASRTTARRYLEYLVSIGKVDPEVSYGTVGRPERRYAVTR